MLSVLFTRVGARLRLPRYIISSYMNAKVTKLNAAKLTEIESHYLTLETVVDVTISPPQGPFSDCSESFYHITPCFPAHGI